MMTKKQMWMLGGLIPLCGAIWVPRFIGGSGGAETSAQVAIDGPTEAEMMEMGGSAHGGFDGGMAGAPAVRPDTTMGGREGGGSTAAPENLGATSNADVLGPETTALSVLNALRSAEAFGVSAVRRDPDRTSESNASQPMGSRGDQAGVAPAETTNAMLAFVADNPLRGTLTGDERRVALLGSYRLEIGAKVPGTSAVVASVERGVVTLDDGEISIELELPPLKADPTRARRSDDRRDVGRTSADDNPIEPDSAASLEETAPAAPAALSAPMEENQ